MYDDSFIKKYILFLLWDFDCKCLTVARPSDAWESVTTTDCWWRWDITTLTTSRSLRSHTKTTVGTPSITNTTRLTLSRTSSSFMEKVGNLGLAEIYPRGNKEKKSFEVLKFCCVWGQVVKEISHVFHCSNQDFVVWSKTWCGRCGGSNSLYFAPPTSGELSPRIH